MDIIKKVPIPTAGVALGFAALGNLLALWSDPLRIVCGVLSLFLVIMLGAKIILYPRLIQDDLKNSILASVSATLFMALMQLATYLASVQYEVAFLVWACAVIAHILLMLWFTVRFIRRFKLPEVFPSYFICYVGIIVASVTSPTFAQQALGRVLFWFGFVCYIVLFALVTYRYAHHEVPEAARPLFCIYAAPMSLSLVGYLATDPAPHVMFVTVMLILAQVLYFFVLFHLPKFFKIGFYPSYAAMTFPFVISATALIKGVAFLETTWWQGAAYVPLAFTGDILGIIESVFATAMVFYVFIHYMRFFFQRIEESASPVVEQEEQEDEAFAEFFADSR